METIKSYTDLEQSKKLAKILPLESADMTYLSEESLVPKVNYNGMVFFNSEEEKPSTIIPCWSLSALLGVIPKGEYIDFDLSFGSYQGDKYIDEWFCSYEKQSHSYLIEVCHAPTPVDACVEMIEKLHEIKIL